MLFGEQGERLSLGFKPLKHSSKCLMDINASKPHKNLWGRYYIPCFRDEVPLEEERGLAQGHLVSLAWAGI